MSGSDFLDEDNPTLAEELRAERKARASAELYWHDRLANSRTAVEQEIAAWLRHEASRDSDRIADAISSGACRKPAQGASE